MGVIKTINEAVRERMNECSGILSKQFMKSVRPIYGSTDHGKPDHIGSCVLLEISKKKYLVTAAHVTDHNENTTLYVSGENGLVQIEAECIRTRAVDGSRDKDKFDFAILLLPDHIVNKLGNVKFLDETNILTSDTAKNGELYLALGFPTSQNKKVHSNENKVTQNPFVYSSTLKTQSSIFKDIQANPETHYLLDFCSKHSKDENNTVVNPFSPIGASGGGLFLIEGMNNLENYRSSSDCSGKLVGILIERHQKQKVIMATKLSVVLNALTLASARTA